MAAKAMKARRLLKARGGLTAGPESAASSGRPVLDL